MPTDSWVLAATYSVLLLLSATGCQSVPDYGIGTPCDEMRTCRNPLVCAEGYCALAPHTSPTARNTTTATTGAARDVALSAGGRVTLDTATNHQGGSGSDTVGTGAGSYVTSSIGGARSSTVAPQVSTVFTSAAGAGSTAPTGSYGTGVVANGLGGIRATGGDSTAVASDAGAGGVGTDRGVGGSSNSSATVRAIDAPFAAGVAGQVSAVDSQGRACIHDSDCSPRHCVDGFCCDSACTEQCKACNLEGYQGQCTVQASGQPIGNRAPCKNAGTVCGGSCNGELSCSYPDNSKTCDDASQCRTRFTRLDRMACDGLGYCAAAITSDCFPNVCNMNADSQCGAHVYTQVDVSESHTCAVTSAGLIKCWGSNLDYGVLGLGERKIYPSPTSVEFILDVKQVAAGWGHTCALVRDGGVQCWGTNFNGDLGCILPTLIVSDTCSTFPVGSGVSSVIAGGEQSCALLSDGRMRCWGRGDLGEIGDGDFKHRFSPTPVVGIAKAVSMTAGVWHGCAVLDGGAVKCWGDNNNGELGVGTAVVYPQPSPVIGIDGIAARALAVSAGIENTCFLLDDQSIRCAGINDYGQLGNTQQARSTIPIVTSEVPLRATQVTVGSSFACAITSSESVKCWGRGTYGTLGNGGFADSATPVDVLLPSGVSIRQIAAKYNHVCAIDTLGNLWCWGDNAFGQLGDGTQQTSAVPVMVGPP